MPESVYDFSCTTPAGEERPLADFRGKVLLVVNTASKCGFTPQFKGLEDMYSEYRDRGLEILGFPCNQFGKQDPGSNDEITGVLPAELRRVSFPMFGKVEVNGDGADAAVPASQAGSTGVPGQRGYQVELHQVPVDT